MGIIHKEAHRVRYGGDAALFAQEGDKSLEEIFLKVTEAKLPEDKSPPREVGERDEQNECKFHTGFEGESQFAVPSSYPCR